MTHTTDMNLEMAYLTIDTVIPFSTIAGYAGIDLPNREGSCYCPFHDNTETPAAKLYRDPEGDHIYCFAEQRMYKPSDIIRKGYLKRDPITIAQRIWVQLTPSAQEDIIQRLAHPPDTMPANWEELEPEMDRYREGTATYQELLTTMLKLRPKRRDEQ